MAAVTNQRGRDYRRGLNAVGWIALQEGDRTGNHTGGTGLHRSDGLRNKLEQSCLEGETSAVAAKKKKKKNWDWGFKGLEVENTYRPSPNRMLIPAVKFFEAQLREKEVASTCSTGKDSNGCEQAAIPVIIINYCHQSSSPRFFGPVTAKNNQ